MIKQQSIKQASGAEGTCEELFEAKKVDFWCVYLLSRNLGRDNHKAWMTDLFMTVRGGPICRGKRGCEPETCVITEKSDLVSIRNMGREQLQVYFDSAQTVTR